MNICKNLQMKLTFLVLTLLVAVILSGAVSAGLVLPEENYPSAYIVENGYSFTGSASIQDAVDNYETVEGYHIELEPGVHEEQVTMDKELTFTGLGANPEDTVIESVSDGGTIIISNDVSVVMENLAIWNFGTGDAIVNNGQLTLINCYVNGNYYENEVMGLAAGSELSPEETTPLTETMNSEEELLGSEPVDETIVGTSEASTEATEPVTTTELVGETIVGTGEASTEATEPVTTTEHAGQDPATDDPGVPLASLASGMLMVMGGTVVSGRKHH